MTILLIFSNLVFIIGFAFYFSRVGLLKSLLESERIKNELVSKKEFVEELLNSIPDPVFVKNKQHQWIYGNNAFSRVVNLPLNEYIGKSDYDVFPKEMADIFWAKDNETLETLKTTENEELIFYDGQVRTISTKKTPIIGSTDGPVLIGVFRDITDRKKNEETIRNLQLLIENSSDLYCICDPMGKPIFINNHGKTMGYTLELVSFTLFFSPEVDYRPITQSLDEHGCWEGETIFINLKTMEKNPFWLKAFYIFGNDRKKINLCFVGSNIKERKDIQSKMFFSSKMASLGEMAAGISHEINNPLSIISGTAHQLKRYLEAEVLDRENLLLNVDKIENTAFRIAKIIKGLRTFSHEEEFEPLEEVNVRKLIDETLDLCREKIRNKSIRLILELDEQIKVECRPVQIQQVLINLLNNSIDAIKDKKESWIKIIANESNNQVRITIIDSGPGIPTELRHKIMAPFFTTKEVGKGTGLGLSISKGIMESNMGALVYNEDSPNTTFVLIFKRPIG